MSGLYFLYGSFLEKCGNVFRADMAELGKYHMGGYGRIGVYRVASSKCCKLTPLYISCNTVDLYVLTYTLFDASGGTCIVREEVLQLHWSCRKVSSKCCKLRL